MFCNAFKKNDDNVKWVLNNCSTGIILVGAFCNWVSAFWGY